MPKCSAGVLLASHVYLKSIVRLLVVWSCAVEARDIKCLRPVFHYSSVDRMSNLMTHIHSHPSDQTHQTSSDVYVSLVLNSCIVSLFGRARVESFLFLSSSLPLLLLFCLSLSFHLPPLSSFHLPSLFLSSSLPYTNGSKHNSILCNGGQPHRKKKRRNCFFYCKGKRRSFVRRSFM